MEMGIKGKEEEGVKNERGKMAQRRKKGIRR